MFKEALKEASEIEADRITGMAYAVRVRNHKQDDFESFIQSLKADLTDTAQKKNEVERLKTLI